MIRHRAQRLIGGWLLVVLGVAMALGAISVYLRAPNSATGAAGFLGTLTGVVVILWGHGIVERTRLSYMDDRLDAIEARTAELETRAGTPPPQPEDPRGP